MKAKYDVRPPIRLELEWDFSLWFAALSPILGILLGLVGAFLVEK
jgi:hypothetical protein